MRSLIEVWVPWIFGEKHIIMDETEPGLVPGSPLWQNTELIFKALAAAPSYAIIVWGL